MSDVESTSYVEHGRVASLPVWRRMRERRVPLSFSFDLTARCNNECRHCYINLSAADQAARERELTRAEINAIADQAVALGTVFCLLTGGEPLLRPDFCEIYADLKKKGLLVTVFTNATLVTARHVALFRQYPARVVDVTVYGVTEETYERVTQRAGSYAAFRRGLGLLLEAGLPVRLKATLCRSNADELPAIAEFCRRLGAGQFRFDPVLHLRHDGDVARNREIAGERLTPQEIARLEASDPEKLAARERQCSALLASTAGPPPVHDLFFCGGGINSFSVTWDGRFALCGSLSQPEYTVDLREWTVADAWTKFLPGLRATPSRDSEFTRECGGCALLYMCRQCPATAQAEHGRIDARCAYFCEVTKAVAASVVEGLRTSRQDRADAL